jgi:hypothetical protein
VIYVSSRTDDDVLHMFHLSARAIEESPFLFAACESNTELQNKISLEAVSDRHSSAVRDRR